MTHTAIACNMGVMKIDNDNPTRRPLSVKDRYASIVLSEEDMEEYLRRNLLVSSAIGARANIHHAQRRLEVLARPQAWLVELLNGISNRLERLPSELAAHRDELMEASNAD